MWLMKRRNDAQASQEALKESHRRLAEARARESRVAATVEDMNRLRRENHFGAHIRKALEG